MANTSMWQNIKFIIKEKVKILYERGKNIKNDKYQTMCLICAILVFAKFLLFYNFIHISSNLVFVLCASIVFTSLIFSIFKNKWVPGIFFLLFSFLIFADVTYYSFFSKYLSVDLLGSAEVVGDIGDSIKEVLRPEYFLLMLDAFAILVTLALKKRLSMTVAEKNTKTQRGLSLLVLVLCFVIVIAGSSESRFMTTIKNQEIYSYHISDIVEAVFGENAGSLEAFEDTYPLEKNGPLFGIAKDRNVIFIQIESFMNFVVGMEYNRQEVTPNLNALIKDNSIYFENFYQQVGSGNTSDAEFAANNSIYGTVLSYTYKVYGETNYFRGFPVLLKEKGYDTAVFHAAEDRDFWNRQNAYPALGFDRYFGGLVPNGGDYEMTDWMGWGLIDSDFFRQTIPLMQQNLKEPYYVFVNTLSNHHPFLMKEEYQFLELKEEDEDTLVGNYLQSAAYTDYSIGLFIEMLKENGMYEDTIFVLYGDHTGLTHSEETDASMSRIIGRTYDYDTMLNVPLIIHIPNPEKEMTQVISTPGGHLDILPTVAYLMGFESLDTIYFGHNLLTIKTSLVPEQTFIKRGSFVADNIMYEMAMDGVFENGRAWDIRTGMSVPLDGLKKYYLRTMEIIQASEYILDADALRALYLEGGKMSEAGAKDTRREYPNELVVCGYPNEELIGRNNIEALTASYDAGYRYIRLTLNWNEDGTEAYTLDGENIAMTDAQLIDWIDTHDDVYIVVDIDGEMVYSLDNTLTFFGQKGELGTKAGRRMILVAETTKEFTGRHDLFLDISDIEAENQDLMNFIDDNDVWAIIIKEEDSILKRNELMSANCGIYIEYEDGLIGKY